MSATITPGHCNHHGLLAVRRAGQHPLQEQLRALLDDLVGTVGTLRLVPAPNPAQPPGDHEGRHFGVARGQHALLHALLDQTAKSMVNFRLQAPQFGAAGFGHLFVAQPQLILLDEPSLGLSPKLTEDIFAIIARINAERGTSMLLVEQNATVALAVAHSGYIMEGGKIVIDGTAERLASDPDVREFYLGQAGSGEAKSFKDIKHYKRRKRWLS